MILIFYVFKDDQKEHLAELKTPCHQTITDDECEIEIPSKDVNTCCMHVNVHVNIHWYTCTCTMHVQIPYC